MTSGVSGREEMDKRSISQVVELISKAKQDKVADGDIAKQLVALGVPATETSNLIECVVIGFKSGVNAIVTGGISSDGYVPGGNPFYDVAFRKGKAAMRFTTPFWVLMKLLAPLIIGVIVIGAILSQMLR